MRLLFCSFLMISSLPPQAFASFFPKPVKRAVYKHLGSVHDGDRLSPDRAVDLEDVLNLKILTPPQALDHFGNPLRLHVAAASQSRVFRVLVTQLASGPSQTFLEFRAGQMFQREGSQTEFEADTLLLKSTALLRSITSGNSYGEEFLKSFGLNQPQVKHLQDLLTHAGKTESTSGFASSLGAGHGLMLTELSYRFAIKRLSPVDVDMLHWLFARVITPEAKPSPETRPHFYGKRFNSNYESYQCNFSLGATQNP